MEQIFSRYSNTIPGLTKLLQGNFFVNVEQLGGRYYNIPLDDDFGNMIGIYHNIQKRAHNFDLFYYGTPYANSENNPVITNTYHQNCLNGHITRTELFFYNMLYSVHIRDNNKIKFKIFTV